jgi:hypothetical protein
MEFWFRAKFNRLAAGAYASRALPDTLIIMMTIPHNYEKRRPYVLTITIHFYRTLLIAIIFVYITVGDFLYNMSVNDSSLPERPAKKQQILARADEVSTVRPALRL